MKIPKNKPLPSHASVVVIGGGVMGCSTLYHLIKGGAGDAVLLERNQLTSGTTWHSAAQVRALRSSRDLTDLIRYSIKLYESLQEETGQQVGWINKGSLSIATNPDRLIHIKQQEALARLFGVAAEMISPQEAKERWPLMHADDVIGAVWSPDDGRVSPSDLCSALVKAAKARGASIFEDTGVTAIHTKAGRICAVETDQGVIKTEKIAICTGLWSRRVAAMAGVDVPVWPCEHFYLLTKPVAGITGNLPTLSDHDGHLYIRDDSGGLLVGCFEPLGKAINPAQLGEDFAFQLLPEDWDHFEPMMHNALHRLPALEHAEVKMLLNGPESFTPDGGFLLGEAAETAGLFLGCGMNSVGVASGGGAGMALAHCMLHGAPPMDLHEVDPKRFDASWNHIGTLADRVPEVLGKHYEIGYTGRQWVTARDLRRLPLHDEWIAAKAHFGQVFGFERPLYFDKAHEPVMRFGQPDWFEQVGNEVNIAHQAVAVTDLSSFGKIDVYGPEATLFLNRICTNDMTRAPGHVIYSLMLNKAGGITSDLTIMRLSETHYRLVVGTAASKRDLAWLQHHLNGENVTINDVTENYVTLGVMGPKTPQLGTAIGAEWLNQIGYFKHQSGMIGGVDVIAARLSYIGEAGWEISCAAQHAKRLYAVLTDQQARPIGSLAQSSMRIEKGFVSYGHDIDTDVTPGMTGLEFALDSKSDFIGKTAIVEAGEPEKRLVSITLENDTAVPLGNEPVFADGRIVGKTTSAAFGYRVGKPVLLALLDLAYCGTGRSVAVEVAGESFDGSVKTGAIFDDTACRMRPQKA